MELNGYSLLNIQISRDLKTMLKNMYAMPSHARL